MFAYDKCPVCKSTNFSFALECVDYTVSKEKFRISHCKDCTHRFTAPVPGEDEIGPYYQSEEYISHSNTSRGFINSIYQRVRNITLRQKKKLVMKATGKAKGKILDVGCGTGEFLNQMKMAGWETQGIEPDEGAREMGKKNYGLSVDEPGAFFDLEKGSYDIVTMWHVLEHVHRLDDYMAQLHQLIKPGGVLIIAVPNYTSTDASYYKSVWAAYDVPIHLYHFSPKSMKHLLNRFKFKFRRSKIMPFDSFYVSMLSEKYRNGFMPWGIMVGGWSWFISLFNTEKCSSLIYISIRPAS